MAWGKKTGRMKKCAGCDAEFYCQPCKDVGGWLDEKRYCSKSCQTAHKRHTPQQAQEAFWSKVDKSGDCWIWTGTRYRAGYGHAVYLQNHMQAHRAAWTIEHGDPGALRVCHRCDNPPCVNPAHLFLGTDTDNMLDKIRKHRDPRLLTADKVHAVRDRLGRMSQLEIARELGLSPTVVSKIKLGKRYSWLETTSHRTEEE
jgi:hypothetical protein